MWNNESLTWPGGIPERKISLSYKEKELKRKQRFIKGPIPLWWIAKAAALPGSKTLHVGLALWYLKGLNKSPTGLKLSSNIFDLFNINRSTAHRALVSLEKTQLIKIHRKIGQKNIIDILEIDENKIVGRN